MRPCRATITYSKTIPAKFPFGQRSFVKASFFDSGKNMLVSKSVLYAPLPEVCACACMQQLWCSSSLSPPNPCHLTGCMEVT